MRSIVICLLMSSAVAHAEDLATKRAKTLFEEGMKQYQVGEYEQALDAFKQAYLTRRNPVFLFNMGQCYRQMKQWEKAAREYRAYLRESPEASNGADVARFIGEAEAEMKEQEKVRLPSPPTPAPAVTLVPVEKESLPPASPPAKQARRWWIPVAIGAAAVVVGAGLGLGLAYGLPNNANAHSGSDASNGVRF